MQRKLKLKHINLFFLKMREDEKSEATISKYKHDINCFFNYSNEKTIDKQLVLAYKSYLMENYSTASVNSMIAALNAFFKFAGWHDLIVKQIKIQRKSFLPEEKELTREEYERLVNSAERNRNKRLSLIIQTICATGIRISELQYITVESVIKGVAVVNCKGKTRTVFLVSNLKQKLIEYIKKENITSGAIFVTKNGKCINRSNIWREMKKLCEQAKVSAQKVFPHNLRHLFARVFYSLEKDIAKLADILGHTNINTTRIYIMTTGSEHKRKMENMRLVI